MAISDYMRALRAKVGHDVILMPSVAGLVFDDAGRMLLARHATADLWAAPGGAVDKNKDNAGDRTGDDEETSSCP